MNKSVHKTSVKASLFKARTLVLALILFFAAQGVWGQTVYTWTGAEDGNWSTPGNWDDGSGNPVTNAPNNSSDDVEIPDSKAVILDLNVTINEITLGSGASLTIDTGKIVSANTITGDNDSVINKGHLITPNNPGNLIDTTNSDGVITVAAASDFVWTGASGSNNYWSTGGNWFGGVVPSSSDTIIIPAVSNQPVVANPESAPATIDASKLTVDTANGANISVTGNLAFTGDFTLSSIIEASSTGTIIVGEKLTNNSVTNWSLLSLKCQTLEVSENLTCKTLNVTSTSTLTNDASLVVTDGITFGGAVTVTGSGLPGSQFTLDGNISASGTSITIQSCNFTLNGTGSFASFTASGLGGKTLKINGQQTITGVVSLSGTNSNKLEITGTGNLVLSQTLVAQYLNFTGTGPTVSAAKAFAGNSLGGAPSGWIVVNGNQHVWNGSAGNTNWATWTNWLPQSVPGTGDDVIIDSTYTGSNNPQITTANVLVNSISITGANAGVVVGEGHSLTLESGCELDTKITGAGTLILASAKNYSITGSKDFDVNIVNNGIITANASTGFKRNFTDSGSWSGTIPTLVFDGTIAQSFTAKAGTDYTDIEISKASGTFTAETAFTADSFTVDSANPCDITFNADNTITTFTATNQGGKTIDFGGTTQDITSFTASSSSDSSLLTLTGTGWTLTAGGTPSISNAQISNSTATNTISVSSCTDLGGNSNWNFLGKSYNWTGATNNSWNTASNWSPQSVPGKGTLVTINSDASSFPIITSNILLTYNATYEGSITNNGKITFSGAGVTTGITAGNISESNDSLIIYDGAITNPVWGNTYKNLQINNGTEITFADATISGKVTNNGTIKVTNSLTAGSFEGSGTINLNGSTTSLATSTGTTSATSYNVVLTSTDATIKGSFEFASFTATAISMSGKSITLDASVTTKINATTLSLAGTGTGSSLLTLAGTGTFDTGSLTNTQYLSIGPNVKLTTYTGDISNKNCQPSAGDTQPDWLAVIHNGWKIKDLSSFTYTWLGNNSEWKNTTNWDTGFEPVTDCKIVIPDGKSYYPVLADATYVGGTLTIEDSSPTPGSSNAKITLGTSNLVLSGTSTPAEDILSNNGTIIYTAGGRITNGTNAINDTTKGTVEYGAGDGGTINNFGDTDDYFNLKISGTKWKLDGNTFKIKNDFNLASGAVCQVIDTPTIQSKGFTIAGNFTVNADKNLILTPYNDTDPFTVPDGIQNKITFSGGDGHRGWLWLGSSTYNGTITFANAATFTYKLYLNGDAVLGADVTLTNSLTAIKSLTGSKSLTFSGTGTQTFTPGTTTSAKIIVNKNSTTQGELILVGNCTLADFEVQKCSLITVNDTPTFTTYTDSAAYGNLVFVNGANFTNAFTRNSGGTTTITGTIAADSVTLKDTTVNGTVNITATGASGTITLNGNVTDAATSTLNLNSPVIIGTGNHSISAGTIVFAAGATIDGDGTANLTLNPTTLVTINENVGDTTPLASFAITGPSSIKCASIKTTGNQSYSGAVNLAGTGDLSLYATGTTPEVTFTANITGAGKTLKLPSAGATAVFGDGVTVNSAIDSDGTVKCTGSVTFKDANSFTNFTATGLGGKTLTFEAEKTQTVSGDLNLSGTSTTSRLALAPTGTGSWTLNCSDPDPSVSYVNVSYSTSINEITATGSNDNGHNVKWNFPGMTYTWKTAAADSDWTKPSNWEEESVPGKGSNVIIPAATPYPVLEADLDLLYNTTPTQGKITVNGTFDLVGNSLKVAEIQNNGTVRANGVNGQSVTGTMKNGDDSTVVYYGTGITTNLFWDGNTGGKQYENLSLTCNVNVDGDINITANKNITIGCSSIQTTGNQTYDGVVVVNEDTTLSSTVTGKLVYFKSTVTGDESHRLTISTADSKFDGAITKLTSLITDAKATFNTNANISSVGTLQTEAADIYCTQITTTGTQTYNGTVTLYQSPQLEATQIAFGSNITEYGATRTLKIKSPKLISSIAVSGEAEIALGTLELLQNVEISSSNAAALKLTVGSITGSGQKLTFAGNTTLFTLKAGIIVQPEVINNKSISCAGAATFNNNYSGTGSLTLSSGTTEFNGDLDLSGVPAVNGFTHSSGTVLINPTGTSATVKGPATFNNFETTSSLILTGANVFNNFTANVSDRTITFPAGDTNGQTVNGNLTLKGTEDHLLTLTSSGTWKIYCSNGTYNHDIQYVKVYYSDNNASSYFLTALHSEDWGGNVKWNFPDQYYTWQGGASGHETDWKTAANWSPQSIPGTGSNIKILQGRTYYPVLEDNVDLWQSDSYKGSIVVGKEGEPVASFNLADKNLKVGTITNYGTVKLIGKSSQTIEADMVNQAGSTVEYTGSGDPTAVMPWDGDNGAGITGKQYANLVFDRPVNIDGDINVTATGNITIKTATIQTSGSQTYDGAVVVNANTTLSSTVTDKLVYFKSTVTGDESHRLTISTADSKFDGAITKLTSLITDAKATFDTGSSISEVGTLQTQAADIKCTQITTTGTQTYKGTVTLYQSPQLEATQISFGANITESGGTRTLKIKSPKLISSIALSGEAEISLGSLELLQDVEISSSNAAALKLTADSITGSSYTLTFAGNTTLFTLKDEIEILPAVINNKSITCAGAATFIGTFTNNAGTITGDTTNGKTLTFEKAYSGTGYLTASSGATAFKADVNLSGTTFTHSNGTVQFNGNGTVQSLTTKADGSTHFYNITVATPAKVSTTSSFFVDGTAWSNTTTSDGFTAATSSQITFTNTSITIGGKNIFNKIVFPTASQTVSVTDSNNITDLTSSGDSQNITFGASNIFGTILVSGAGTNLTAQNIQNEFNDTITIGSTSVAAGNISLKAKTTLSFAAYFNCNSVTLDAAANAVTFNGNAQYNSSFVNNGTAATNFLASFKGNGNATFVSDAIFKGTTSTSYELSCPAANLIKCKNFVLYSGNYTFGGKLETTGDVIILGDGYNIDNDPDSPTGISGVFAYNQTRLSDPQFTGTFPAAASLSGTLTANADATIKVGKNFYANGTSLQGSNAWYIQLPKICDADQGFAEAINTTAKNCKVSCWQTTNTEVDDTADAKIVAYNCTDNTGNDNWNFADFTIAAAHTVRDNAVYVEFSAPVRNLHNEVNNSIAYLTYKGTTNTRTSFSGIYSQPDCQADDKIENVDVNLTDGKYILYLLAPDTWNTDATGKTPGTTDSTDRHGNKKTSVPYLDIPRSLTATVAGTTNNVNYIITNKWGKRLTNYSTRTTTASHAYGETGDTHDVLDKTGPVLYSVRTGQELHTASNDEANVKSIDSHNFIEFRYSEPVKFDDSASLTYTALNTIPADPDDADQNIQVTDDFGALIGDITTEGPLKFKGLGQIDGGLIHTGNNGSTDKYVNSLYRRDAYSISISIAGYTNGTVTDNSGYTYKKWPGYIEQAELPNGQVTFLVDADNKNLLVKDLDGNAQEKYAHDDSNTIPTVDSTTQGLYGKWDISEPIFAIIRQNSQNTPWTQAKFNTNYQSEAIGSTPGGVGSSLDRIEFHVYDNTPDFNDTDAPTWFTEVGWCGDPDTSEDKTDSFLLSHNTYAADIFGGSRPFATDAYRTSGGLRYSTVQNSAAAFKYGVGSSAATTSFDTSIYVYGGASSLIFTGTSLPRRAAQDPEGLYFALPLTGNSYDLKTSFTVHYDDTVGFITDLAGNRLRAKTVSTIDRTPPGIDMTISPIGRDEVEVVFVKELCIDSDKLEFLDNTTGDKVDITENFNSLITQCFDIITIDNTGAPHNDATSVDLSINTSVPAKVWVEKNSNDSAFTHIRMKLNRAVKLEDLTKYYLRVVYVEKYGELSTDLFTRHQNSRITFIQDENGNTIQMYTAHALSDFAVGEVNPLYAYDSSMTEGDGTIISGGLWHKDNSDDVDTESWAVHDWNRTQTNYGTLPAGHTVAIVADTVSAANVKIYLANHPDEKSVSTQANKDFEFTTPWRIWLPDIMAPVFTSLAEKNNTKYSQNTGTLLNGKSKRFIFDLDSAITDLWKAGDQVSFIFGITNADGSPVTITHAPELDINIDKNYLTTSTKMPLFALRQTEEDNFMSLDLWSFRLKSIVAQRGGVTILNNVINSAVGEKVVLRVDLPEESNLKVLVMTLDGNIVDYLARGVTSSGEHYYSWDGSNRNGKPVARGMYFIRVMAEGIDETRKVLVVKE